MTSKNLTELSEQIRNVRDPQPKLPPDQLRLLRLLTARDAYIGDGEDWIYLFGLQNGNIIPIKREMLDALMPYLRLDGGMVGHIPRYKLSEVGRAVLKSACSARTQSE